MISVSDILKILDKTPVWKQLRELPERMEKLEKRVAYLESTRGKPDHEIQCVICGAQARVADVKPHPVQARKLMGHKIKVVTCDNGHTQEYDWDPKGRT